MPLKSPGVPQKCRPAVALTQVTVGAPAQRLRANFDKTWRTKHTVDKCIYLRKKKLVQLVQYISKHDKYDMLQITTRQH